MGLGGHAQMYLHKSLRSLNSNSNSYNFLQLLEGNDALSKLAYEKKRKRTNLTLG